MAVDENDNALRVAARLCVAQGAAASRLATGRHSLATLQHIGARWRYSLAGSARRAACVQFTGR